MFRDRMIAIREILDKIIRSTEDPYEEYRKSTPELILRDTEGEVLLQYQSYIEFEEDFTRFATAHWKASGKTDESWRKLILEQRCQARDLWSKAGKGVPMNLSFVKE